jgi:hypothetical protein
VARMIGMAVGLAVLTAYGSTRIDSLSAQIYGTSDGYKAVVPPDLASRPLQDPLVVQALEAWAATQAAGTMVALFLVAGVVTVIAIPPGLALAARPRILKDRTGDETQPAGAGTGGGDGTDGTGAEPVAL